MREKNVWDGKEISAVETNFNSFNCCACFARKTSIPVRSVGCRRVAGCNIDKFDMRGN